MGTVDKKPGRTSEIVNVNGLRVRRTTTVVDVTAADLEAKLKHLDEERAELLTQLAELTQ